MPGKPGTGQSRVARSNSGTQTGYEGEIHLPELGGDQGSENFNGVLPNHGIPINASYSLPAKVDASALLTDGGHGRNFPSDYLRKVMRDHPATDLQASAEFALVEEFAETVRAFLATHNAGNKLTTALTALEQANPEESTAHIFASGAKKALEALHTHANSPELLEASPQAFLQAATQISPFLSVLSANEVAAAQKPLIDEVLESWQENVSKKLPLLSQAVKKLQPEQTKPAQHVQS